MRFLDNARAAIAELRRQHKEFDRRIERPYADVEAIHAERDAWREDHIDEMQRLERYIKELSTTEAN